MPDQCRPHASQDRVLLLMSHVKELGGFPLINAQQIHVMTSLFVDIRTFTYCPSSKQSLVRKSITTSNRIEQNVYNQ